VADHRMVIRRTDEQSVVDALLGSLRDGMSQALVMRGEPGIGKTTLLGRLIESASDAEIAVVAGVESEAGLGFATIHRLLTPYLDGVNRLPAPQRSALEVALGLRDGPPGTPFLVGLGVLSLLADAARNFEMGIRAACYVQLGISLETAARPGCVRGGGRASRDRPRAGPRAAADGRLARARRRSGGRPRRPGT